MPDADDATYRTGELDLLYTGGALWIAIGPNSVSDTELIEAFDRIAAWGPQNRVGLLPRRNTRHWRVVAHPGSTFLLPPCPVDCGDFEQVVANSVKVRPESPIAVWRCGDYLCIYCDHGIGDGSYLARLVAALTNPAALANFDPDNIRASRHPYALALWTGVRSQPRQLAEDVVRSCRTVAARLWAAGRARRHRPAASEPTVSVGSLLAAEEATTVFVSSGPTFLKGLRAQRDTAHPGVSTTVLVMFAICRSLRSACGAMSDEVELLADMRRFLPAGSTTFGNFASVVKVPLGSEDTPEVFSAAVTKEVGSYRSIFVLTAMVTLSRLRYSWPRERRRPSWYERAAQPGDGRTKITLTDWAKFPANARIRWADGGRAELGIATPPATREHIVILLTSPGDDRVQVSARFYPSHISADAVRAALTEALGAPSTD